MPHGVGGYRRVAEIITRMKLHCYVSICLHWCDIRRNSCTLGAGKNLWTWTLIAAAARSFLFVRLLFSVGPLAGPRPSAAGFGHPLEAAFGNSKEFS